MPGCLETGPFGASLSQQVQAGKVPAAHPSNTSTEASLPRVVGSVDSRLPACPGLPTLLHEAEPWAQGTSLLPLTQHGPGMVVSLLGPEHKADLEEGSWHKDQGTKAELCLQTEVGLDPSPPLAS